MTRSKQERMPVILSVCLTQKGCSVEIAGTAYSPGLVALRTTIILRRDAVFTSSFGCGRAAVCVRRGVPHAVVRRAHLTGVVVGGLRRFVGEFDSSELDNLLAEGEQSIEQDGTLGGEEAFRRRAERRKSPQ